MKTLAHLSDLHLGRSREIHIAAERLVDELVRASVDHVLVTGDVTHRGLTVEWELFRRTFAPLLESGRLTLVPGNHNRLNDDTGRFMQQKRIAVAHAPGLHIVRFDSTGPHNRSLLLGHGQMTADNLAALDRAISSAVPGSLVVVMLHHHPLPLPEESLSERFSSLIGWPAAAELGAGLTFIERCLGKVDVIAHGHRHEPNARVFEHGARPLRIYNAGATTELEAFRVLKHAGGRIVSAAEWRTVIDESSAVVAA